MRFRRTTGQSPHQFVLHSRVERAKEILRAADSRVLDVAVACGFKMRQHFVARVFRQVCGVSLPSIVGSFYAEPMVGQGEIVFVCP